MARAAATEDFAISVKYHGNLSYPLQIKGNHTVEQAIRKSVEGLGLDQNDIDNLQLVHQGAKLRKNSLLEDELRGKYTTCCFLQKCNVMETSLTRSDVESANHEQSGNYLGICNTCKIQVTVRPIFKCSVCKQTSFVMNRRVDLFTEDHSNIRGNCCTCNKEIKPEISYECVAADAANSHEAMPLFQLRENVLKLPCMKCEHKGEQIIRFLCGHTMCLECFVSMCRMMHEVENGFKIKQGSCYTVFCPAGEENCSFSHIVDPHHFRLMDSEEFYDEYKQRSIHGFIEATENNKCKRCDCDLDMTQGQVTKVDPPIGTSTQPASQRGWGWYQTLRNWLWKSPSVSSATATREQVKCPNCQVKYCGQCKEYWHHGDCIKISKEQEEADKQYKIDPDKAASSMWKQ